MNQYVWHIYILVIVKYGYAIGVLWDLPWWMFILDMFFDYISNICVILWLMSFLTKLWKIKKVRHCHNYPYYDTLWLRVKSFINTCCLVVLLNGQYTGCMFLRMISVYMLFLNFLEINITNLIPTVGR